MSEHETEQAGTTKKGRWKRLPLWGRVAAIAVPLMVAGGIGAALEDEPADDSEASNSENAEAAPTEEAPTEEAVDEAESPEGASTPAEGEADLAGQVEEAALSTADADSFQGIDAVAPIYAVTELETVGGNMVRINVQEYLSDQEKEDTARWFFNATCEQAPGVDFMIVRDLDGVDDNFSAGRYSLLPACQDQ